MPNTSDFIMRLKGNAENLDFIEKIFKGENTVLKFKAPIYETKTISENVLEVRGYSHYYTSYSTTDQPINGAFEAFLKKVSENKKTPSYGWVIYSGLLFYFSDFEKGKYYDLFQKINRRDLIWAFEEEPLLKKDPLKIIEDLELKERISRVLNDEKIWEEIKNKKNNLFTPFEFRKHVLKNGFPKPHEFEKLFKGKGEIYVNLQSLCWALGLHAEIHGLEPNGGFEEFFTIYPDKIGESFHETVEVMEGGECKLAEKFTI